ncbi:MAG: methylenetetrahydrofolate reductase, partial [Clostridia bacterium]|nr:methylenetetrahydrofolate reductase [Clostridia bacterium]
MKISELLKSDRISLSFEVFPPKTSDSFEAVAKAVDEIAALRPSFMSVTYGAGGGTSRYTLDIAKEISEKYGVPTIAHLTCVSSSRESVAGQIKAIREAGIENVLALRGDIPKEKINDDRSAWDYEHATDLIKEL